MLYLFGNSVHAHSDLVIMVHIIEI